MKIRAIAAAAAALVILAACGGSEPSAGSTRTKNAALETIPCAKGGLCKLGDTGPNGGIVVDIRDGQRVEVDPANGVVRVLN